MPRTRDSYTLTLVVVMSFAAHIVCSLFTASTASPILLCVSVCSLVLLRLRHSVVRSIMIDLKKNRDVNVESMFPGQEDWHIPDQCQLTYCMLWFDTQCVWNC